MAAPRVGTLGVRYHADGRRAFYGDIFDRPDGDINIVYLQPAIPIAWHRHHWQTDQLFLIAGALRVQMFLDTPHTPLRRLLTEDAGHRGPVMIPRGWWHGYEAIGVPTIILQFNGPGKWDGTDEERHPIDDEMPWTL